MIVESHLTTEDVTAWLRVNKRTLYRMVRAGRIPAVRVGRQWRFSKSDLDAWLQPQASPPAPSPLTSDAA